MLDIVTKLTVRRAALNIASSMIAAARTSGDDPIAWVTGNAFYPPLRSYSDADMIWQHPANDDGEAFAWLTELVESHLDGAHVALDGPEYDNSLYVVDLDRFEFVESPGGRDLQDDWQPVTA